MWKTIKAKSMALCAAVVLLASGTAARADITMAGTGKVTAVPDIAHVTLMIVSQGETSAKALEANNEAMRRLFELLARFQIVERDVQTTQFAISPVHQQVANSQPVLVGYVVSNEVNVTVRKIADTGKVLDAMAKAGMSAVSGVTFAVADPEKLLDEARLKAIQQARHKADLYAKATDSPLGPVKAIAEQQAVPQLEWRLPAAALKGDGAVLDNLTKAVGEKELSVTVTVVYEIAGRK